ncbi:hypothetical protein WJ42_16270 [Burkholderia cepacia]|nr:hypothetical protein WJ42_16270 [Burkholderia cepacia]KWC65698.1 hypothetical protein WL55_22830 [Burkholderia cepacia]
MALIDQQYPDFVGLSRRRTEFGHAVAASYGVIEKDALHQLTDGHCSPRRTVLLKCRIESFNECVRFDTGDRYDEP